MLHQKRLPSLQLSYFTSCHSSKLPCSLPLPRLEESYWSRAAGAWRALPRAWQAWHPLMPLGASGTDMSWVPQRRQELRKILPECVPEDTALIQSHGHHLLNSQSV